jgi:hypothetical protein
MITSMEITRDLVVHDVDRRLKTHLGWYENCELLLHVPNQLRQSRSSCFT